jgi:8-amino-7-oxononanoate synthase
MSASPAQTLQRLREQHLYRSRLTLDSATRAEAVIHGRRYVTFCSNDYLGLANHPKVIDTLRTAAAEYGVGSGASHLVTGHRTPHHALEEELAAFTGRPRALLFSTGYMANIGAITALAGHDDAVFGDRLNHASLIDAGRLSGALFKRYRHADTTSLESLLLRHPAQTRLIASDGVFSMDGDLAPLPALVHSARQHRATLIIDDAHGLGVLGSNGGGSCEHHGVGAGDVPLLIGTLGKAFGTFGAFVAGADDVIELLIQRARSYIYTTALPPAIAAATRTSLKLVQTEPWRRERLHELITRFCNGARQLGLPTGASSTPIQPLILGDAATALRAADYLRDHGLLITAIRPPTVPAGTARLRITLSAAHSNEQVDQLLDTLHAAIGTSLNEQVHPE